MVITSLLYPAIAIASSSQTHFFAFSLRVLDAFLTPDDISSYFAHEDLRHLWEGHNVLRVREDSVARARCGKEGIIRSERILVHAVPQEDNWSSLTYETLSATLRLEDRINELLATRRVPCIRTPDKRCFTLSPLAFWDHDERAMLRDPDIFDTLGRSRNTTVSGINVTPDMVLAGRGDPAVTTTDTTMFLVLTYFFPDADCLANTGHFAWLHVLEDASASFGDLIMQAQEPTLIALEVRPISPAFTARRELTFGARSTRRIFPRAAGLSCSRCSHTPHICSSSYTSGDRCAAWTLYTRVSVSRSPAS